MNKRIVSLLLALVMLISMVPVVAITADAATSLDYAPYAKIEYGYSTGVSIGTIRYIQQMPNGSYFYSAYWPSSTFGGYAGSSTECGTSSISMALSYVGVNETPKHLLESTNGYTAQMWKNYGNVTCSSVGTSASSISSAMDNYINGNGKYSPLVIQMTPYPSSGNQHFVILAGKVSDNKYFVVDPARHAGWTMTVSGSSASLSWTSGTYPITSVHQWYNPDASLEHECDKGTYKYNWDAHPHYKCYACSVCGKINEFRDETVPLNTCDQCRPGKPVLDVDTNDDGVVTFSWSNTANTTHYNVWLQEKDERGEWDTIEQFFRVESGFTHTLEIGEYRAQLLSYSDKMWEPDGSDWVHTWADDVYFNIEGCKHNYTTTRVDATCVDYGYTTYTCTECGDTYTVYDGDYTEWSTTKPSGVDEDLIETKTQYRYADKETTTSYEPSLSGWTQVGGEWQQSGTGSVTYVKSWPSGFLTSHSLYGTYNKTPKSASETNTDKTTINSDKTTGYLYYHWCRGVDQPQGPINRTTKPTKQSGFERFCAFYSTDDPYTKQMDTSDNSVVFANGNCCNDSHWYFFTPVNTQNYTTYRKLFTYERWGDWSDWSDTVYTAGSNRKVETRTMYRAVEVELGDHDYQDGYCTVCGEVDPDYNFIPVILGVADVSAAPGDTVTIPVTISDNTGFAGFTLCIDYNESVMTLTNISKGNLLNNSESGAFTKNVSGKTINWVDSANIMGDGELMKLTFTIDGDAAPGSYDVELSLKNGNSNNFVDENSRAIHVEFESGIVSVQEPAPAVTLEKIEVATAPNKTVYQIGESLDTTGLTLKATYSDKTTKTITSGYTVSGFDSSVAGPKTVTVSYNGKNTTFTVTVQQREVDPDAPKIIIDSVKAAAGEMVTVEARLENNPGINSVSMKIAYDTTRLKLESAQFGPELSEGAFTNYNLPYVTLVRNGDCYGDVILVTLTFSVLADAEAGDAYVNLEYEAGDITNYDEEDVDFVAVSGGVTVVDYVPGDINGDGKVNSKDLTRLLKYISHEDVEVNEAALDVNGDGKVNSKDLTRLLKYISHEDVEIH